MPSHGHGVTDPTHFHYMSGGAGVSVPVFWNFIMDDNPVAGNYQSFMMNPSGTQIINRVDSALTGISIQPTGSGTAHNVIQPSSFWNIMIKL
jgi:hypothetical protein